MERKLPVILRREEVKLLLDGPKNLGHRTILTTMYAAGLRASEVANLKAADIASDAVAEVAPKFVNHPRSTRRSRIAPKV